MTERESTSMVLAPQNKGVRLRAYAPEGEGAYPAVPLEVLRQEMFSRPSARYVYRQRFGRAISLDRIEIALRAAHSGNMRQLTDLSRETVETDPHLGAVLNKRFGAVSSLPYEIRPASGHGIDKGRALFYAAVVREQLSNLKHFRRNLKQLAWALFDGRAALECLWIRIPGPSSPGFGSVRLAVDGIGWIHPRRLSFGPFRELRVTEERISTVSGSFASSGISLDDFPPGKFVQWTPQLFGEYPEREGLAPRCMYWSFFKRYGQRDRMILMELFGKPWRVVEVDEESSASDEDLQGADDAADGLGAAYTARMPRGTKLSVIQPGRTAGAVHKDVIEEVDKQISKLVLGQTGTTDGVPAGLNSSQASVMQDEQLMILTSDAAELGEVVEAQLTDVIIAVNFGPAALPHAPRFVLRSDLPADRNSELDRVQKGLDAGLEIAASEAYEVSGFRVPERDEPIIRMDQPPMLPISPTPPAARPIVVWPEGSSPPAGEQNPTTPQAAPGEGARQDTGVSVGSADQSSIMTVNEARVGQGLEPLALPDGSPDPDGDLTVNEFNAKRGGDPALAAEPPEADPEIAKQSLNGAQIAGVLDIIERYKTGSLEFDSAAELLVSSFPFSRKQAEAILGSPGAPAPPAAPAPTEPTSPGEPVVDPSEQLGVSLTVKNEGGRWCVYSEDGTRSFGCYDTPEGAADRLREVEAFKHMAVDHYGMSIEVGRAILFGSAAAELELRPDLAAVKRFGEELAPGGVHCSRQPETVNGSVEDLLERGSGEMQRAVKRWADKLIAAVDGQSDAQGVVNAASRVREELDLQPFARALERRLVHGLALGALDSWFDDDEEETPVEPVAFADVNPAFTKMKFDDAMRYFKGKNVMTRAQFDRLSAVAKQKAFTVAALSSDQMLNLTHAELARQIGVGADIRSFSKFLTERLTSAGFVAPTAKAQASYVQMVFRTNTLGAYNAGRHARMSQPEVVRARPYWQIRTISDDRRRPNHARADGVILRATDPFWQKAYPPFGFNCRCRVVSLSETQAQNMTVSVGAAIDYLPDPGFVSGSPSLLAAVWSTAVQLARLDVVLADRAVQTLIFDKDKFETRDEALNWARSHDFSADTSRETEGSWRIRQRPPEDFKDGTLRTKEIAPGVDLVDGELVD